LKAGRGQAYCDGRHNTETDLGRVFRRAFPVFVAARRMQGLTLFLSGYGCGKMRRRRRPVSFTLRKTLPRPQRWMVARDLFHLSWVRAAGLRRRRSVSSLRIVTQLKSVDSREGC
jgi:hypothetical protein